MILTERHIIKETDNRFAELDNLCYLSKNLYNAGLYTVRQYYFNNNKFLSYVSNVSIMSATDNIDYRTLPSKVSQQTLKLVEQNFKSFFGSLKAKVGKVKIPKYLPKDGRQVVVYTNQAVSKKWLTKGLIKLSNCEALIKTNVKDIKQVRIVPKGNHIVVEVLYEADEKILKEDNGRYCSIDLGLNNLATIGSNVIKPIIVNGKPLKSINQYYNKKLAKLKSNLNGNKKTSKRIKSLTLKRNNKIKDYLHKASRLIINHLISNNINTLVIGKNDGWKKEIRIGKRNNQNFVQIPHTTFVNMLQYKAKLEGINVILQEESYTSKCSFLDNEDICKHVEYKGKRIKRGLFRTKLNRLINADLNGALNILKKAVGEFQYPIEVCSTPLVSTIKHN